jgi:hypothetical protein
MLCFELSPGPTENLSGLMSAGLIGSVQLNVMQ